MNQRPVHCTWIHSYFHSDDELEPYDMSNDQKVVTAKSPLYVRNCMEGLLNSEKPDQVEICLKTASALIRKHISTVKEVGQVY